MNDTRFQSLHRYGPATRALEKLTNQARQQDRSRKRRKICDELSRHEGPKMKRSTFWMGSLVAIIEPLQEPLSFPLIEWCDDDEQLSSAIEPAKERHTCPARVESFQTEAMWGEFELSHGLPRIPSESFLRRPKSYQNSLRQKSMILTSSSVAEYNPIERMDLVSLAKEKSLSSKHHRVTRS